MLQTPLCTLLGIEFPIIQAGMGAFTSAELAAAVSNAGGLGSVGTFLRPVEDLPQQLARLREWTSRPFAVNHLVPALDEGAFAHTLAARPPVIVFALGDPGDLVQRAHDVGSLVIHQVTTVQQAREAAERGVDVIIAQGGEAAGHRGSYLRDPYQSLTGTLALARLIVRAVKVPVVAAGGIMDGAGVAAVLALGAQAAQLGTAFLPCPESGAPQVHKDYLLRVREDETCITDRFSGKPARGIESLAEKIFWPAGRSMHAGLRFLPVHPSSLLAAYAPGAVLPRPLSSGPQVGVNDLRIRGIERDLNRAGIFVFVQHAPPRRAAVG